MTANGPLESRRILVVEDQYYLATDICEWLTDAGAQVLGPARDAEQACDLLEREAVDMAVVDINLGMGPSYKLAEELTGRSVPFLFATGYDQAAIPSEFHETPRIEKPFNGRDLVAAIQALGPASTPS
jgi:DNA-binding response OmpR family regulator